MPDGAEALPDVAKTAVGVAAIRALESARPDRLFDDPLAPGFVAASGRTLPEVQAAADADDISRRYWIAIQYWVVVRTRFLDELLLAASARGIRQVVLLAAGLDARAFRLAWPGGTRLFELDLPEMLEFKERVLAAHSAVPRCERHVVPGDLLDDWPAALTAAGLHSDEPTVWIAEGLLAYLTAAQNDELLTRLSALASPGSALGLTLRNQTGDEQAVPRPAQLQALWQSEGVADAAAWLSELGWTADVFLAAERGSAYGRPLPDRDGSPRAAARLVRAVRS